MSDAQDRRDTHVFKHAKMSPEVAPHKRHWDRSKCKRNKGGPHNPLLVKNELVTYASFRT